MQPLIPSKFPALTALLLCISGIPVLGQTGYWPLDTYQQYAVERQVIQLGEHSHLNVWPMVGRDLPKGDSALHTITKSLEGYWSGGPSGKWEWQASPIADLSVGWSSEVGALYTTVGGAQVRASPGEKFAVFAEVFGGVERASAYIGAFADSLGVVPGLGLNRGSGDRLAYVMPTVAISYMPSRFFQIDAGFGNHRLGPGYRSFTLSDAAFNYPYLRITTDVWRFKYTNLFAAMTHLGDEVAVRGAREAKYMASHHLSWAVSRRVTFSVFESVIWQGRDTLSERGFDVQYLNPVIFYRPVEFAMGSPDRVLIGADLSVKVGKKYKVYGQLVFDEFLLEYLRERTGWWANKWAVQLGITGYDVAGIEGLRVQAEYNVARPFIYSHGSVIQNYAHFNQPLAHPLGSNFREAVAMAFYERDQWYCEWHAVASRYGRDDGLNLGGDLFRSYVNPAFTFGNTIGQGLRHDLFFQRITIGRVIDPRMNLRLSLRYTMRSEEVGGQGREIEHFYGLSVSTGLRNRYRDF